ncbi:MAG: alpha,alpha-trehalase TreF [Sphingobacteriales bacterium]
MKKMLFVFLLLRISIAGAQLTPRQLYPGLFEAVQTSNIFPDNKTFVDAIAKQPANIVIREYNLQKNGPDFDLKHFVLDHFTVPHVMRSAFKSDINAGIRKHIDTLWQVLQRKPDTLAQTSLVPLPGPYIVPGGRFREVYYWDSYFTMLGLQQSHQIAIIHHMIDNFAYLIDRFGFIPNGNRTYYLTRSQPPFFSLMVNLLSKIEGKGMLIHYQPQLLKEYAYWMNGAEQLKTAGCKSKVVRMPGGEILNRYWDDSEKPREESYLNDVTAAKQAKQGLPQFYRNVRAAAASGWDFSSRWFDASQKLTTIQTTHIVPIDLNCLLYNLELTIAKSYIQQGDLKHYQYYRSKASFRKKAILKYCWNAKEGWFDDYNFILKHPSSIQSLAGVFPLEFKIANKTQADRIAASLKNKFLKAGGLVTTLNQSGQQWDAPNGWAPLQYIAIDGLSKYEHEALAKDIAERWIHLNIRVFNQTGKLLEKYNVVDARLTAGGGEYPLQDGFGWTNGVLLTLMNRYNVQ